MCGKNVWLSSQPALKPGGRPPSEVITLRYILSRRWNLEAQSATNDNRAGLNYRFEK